MFFHPLVWFVARQVSELSEHACDDVVLDSFIEPIKYAEILTNIASRMSKRSFSTELSAGIVFSKHSLLRRVEMILSENRSKIVRFSKITMFGTMLSLVVSLMVAVAIPIGEVDNSAGEMIDISGTVIYDGEALNDAVVYLLTYDTIYKIFNKCEKVAETGKNGSFSFKINSFALKEKYKWAYPKIAVYKPGISIGWSEIPDNGDKNNIIVNLKKPTFVKGIIKDKNGKPVPDAEVSVSGVSYAKNNNTSFDGVSGINGISPDFKTITTSGGQFELKGMPENTIVSLKIVSPGYVHTSKWGIKAGSDNEVIVIEPEGFISGKVIYGNNDKPASGILVAAEGMGYIETTETDKDGKFIITGIPKGNYTLKIPMNDNQNQWASQPVQDVPVEEGKTTKGIELKLVNKRIITGRVSDIETGEPVRGHIVTAQNTDTAKIVDFSACKTDMNGYYKLNVPPGKININILAPEDYENIPQNHVVEVEEGNTLKNIDFRFKKGIEITGKVLSPAGKPVPDAVISQIFEENNDWNRHMFLKSGKDGTFKIKGLTEGRKLVLNVEQEDLKLKGKTETDVKSGVNLIINLEKYETKKINGRVVDEQGKPVPGANIELTTFYENGIGFGSVAAVADSEGKYKVEGLVEGNKYALTAKAKGYTDGSIPISAPPEEKKPSDYRKILPDGKNTPVETVLYKADRWIEGTISDEQGEPVAGANLTINGGPSGFKMSVTDSKGNFRIDSLSALIEMKLYVRHKDYGDYSFRFLETNKKQNLILIKKQHTFEGYIHDTENNPVSGADVSVDPQIDSTGRTYMSVTTDNNGRFIFNNVVNNELNLFVYYPEKGIKKFGKTITNSGIVKLVYDKPDENKRPDWEFIEKGVVLLEGKPAPQLNVSKWVNGNPVNLSQLKGKVVVLNFWTSENEYFVKRLNIPNAIIKKYGNKDVVVIGIHPYTNDSKSLEKIIKEQNVQFNVAIDSKSQNPESMGKTFDAYGFSEVDEHTYFIVIDKKGLVHQDIYADLIDKKIKELLK